MSNEPRIRVPVLARVAGSGVASRPRVACLREGQRPVGLLRVGLLAGLLVFGWPATSGSAPAPAPLTPSAPTAWQPADDDVVVERVPRRIVDRSTGSRVRTAGAAAATDPRADLGSALRTARALIERARQSGDPRAMGEAQAVLGPWWPSTEPPASVRLLRATILQHGHDFAAAFRDLDALIAAPVSGVPSSQPGADGGAAAALVPSPRLRASPSSDASRSTPDAAQRAQALLTRSALHLLQGRPADAARDCGGLAALAAAGTVTGTGLDHHAALCATEVAGRRGRAAWARDRMTDLARRAPPGQEAWVALLRGELAARLGDNAAADRWLRDAAERSADVYSRSAWIDHLLRTGRPQLALQVLDAVRAASSDPAAGPAGDALDEIGAFQLRRAIAWQALGDAAPRPELARLTADLAADFRLARLRGDAPHWREQARFELQVRLDAPAALALAEANWAEQREPIDAWLLVEAARRAGRPDAAAPVRAFQAETGFQDVRLDRAWRAVADTDRPARVGLR
jgi:hypothetical protein